MDKVQQDQKFTSLTSNNVQKKKKLKLNAVLLKLMLKLMSNGMEKKQRYAERQKKTRLLQIINMMKY
jgi:hypothetical protein